jgi:zinc protease
MRALPDVGPERPLRLPRVHRESLPNGLTVVIAPRPNVPRIELRLMIPSGTAADVRRQGAAAWMLAETLDAGTTSRSSVDISYELQRIGGELTVRAADDYLWISGGVLSRNVRAYLDLLAEVITSPGFPAREIDIARDRVLQRLIEQRADPGFIASELLYKRMLDSHPYAMLAPPQARIEESNRDAIRRFYRAAVGPSGATIVLVGDLKPASGVEAARKALGKWQAKATPSLVPAPPEPQRRPTLVSNRAGAVQTNIRFGTTVPRRTQPEYFAAAVANTIFGGYFSSRLVENIRERKGYTYGPGSGFAEHRAANFLSARADVRTDVTAAALTEIRYELGRMCALPVERAELEGARRYLLGLQALSLQSQQGLAAQLATLESYGVGVEFLQRYREEIKRVTTADVLEASRRYLSPKRMSTILVGDADRVTADLSSLEDLEVSPHEPVAARHT